MRLREPSRNIPDGMGGFHPGPTCFLPNVDPELFWRLDLARPIEVVQRVCGDLRIALKNSGFGECLPLPGHIEQKIEVRFLQGLLKAFRDPDFYFGTWLARGVWQGSPSRKLPRTPALYERKTKRPIHDESV